MHSFSNTQFIRKNIPYSFRLFSVFSSGLDEIDKSLYLNDGFYTDWASPDLFRIAKHDISFLRKKIAPLMQQLNINGLFNDIAQIYLFSDYDRLQMMKLGMYNPVIDFFLFKMDVQDNFYLKYNFNLPEIKNEVDFYSENKLFSPEIHNEDFLFKIDTGLRFCKELNKSYLSFLIDKFKKQNLDLFVYFLQNEQIINEMKDVCFFYNDNFMLKGDFFFYRDLQDIKCKLKSLQIVDFYNDRIINASFLIDIFDKYNLDLMDFNKKQLDFFGKFYFSDFSSKEEHGDINIQDFIRTFFHQDV